MRRFKMINTSRDKMVTDDTVSNYWKRRPSEIKGYQKAFYINEEDGSYLRIDYNLKDKKVRIFLEEASEGGISYLAVIANGKIISEKNLATGRNTSLAGKFGSRAELIATVPHREVLSLIGDNYRLDDAMQSVKAKQRKVKLEKTREKYFKDEDDGPSFLGEFNDAKSFSWVDLVDVFIGGLIVLIIYYFTLRLNYCGIFLAIYGIAVGIIDMFVRVREPIFVKILLFLISGFAAYVYGYYIS